MTKACIASETWSKAEAEEDNRLTDSAAPAHTSCPNQSRVRKQLPHSLHPCPMAQLIAKTTTALHPHSGGGNQRSRKNEDTRDTTHDTQHRQIDPHTHCYYHQHTRLPPAENSSQNQRRRREVGWENKSGRTDQYMAAMDRQRAYHAARKSAPEYNRRQKRLACEHGQRRAAHDRASHSRGHEYQHTPPLYEENENGEEVRQKRKARRSKEQMDNDKAEEEAEKRRLMALFECGDTTFTTLGVIDVNLQPKGRRGRKKEKRGDERVEEEAETGKEEQAGKEEMVTRAAGKENSDPSSLSVRQKRQRGVEPVERKEQSAERTPVLAVVVTDVSAAGRLSAVNTAAVCAPVAARMITFR